MSGSPAFRTVAALAAALTLFSVPAQSAGPFRPFLGSWRGAGEILSADGRREPISCRARYDGADGDRAMTQSLVCASDSFRLNVEISATAEGGALNGEWRETTRNVQGRLSGAIGGGDFRGAVSGDGFTAQVSIRASGRRQSVSMQPSAGDIRSVDITLTRAR